MTRAAYCSLFANSMHDSLAVIVAGSVKHTSQLGSTAAAALLNEYRFRSIVSLVIYKQQTKLCGSEIS